MRREKLGNGTLFLNPGSRLLTPCFLTMLLHSRKWKITMFLHSRNFYNVTPFLKMEISRAVALVASLLATGYGNNLINKLLYQLLHVGAFYQGACVEVNPVWLVLSQITVG